MCVILNDGYYYVQTGETYEFSPSANEATIFPDACTAHRIAMGRPGWRVFSLTLRATHIDDCFTPDEIAAINEANKQQLL